MKKIRAVFSISYGKRKCNKEIGVCYKKEENMDSHKIMLLEQRIHDVLLGCLHTHCVAWEFVYSIKKEIENKRIEFIKHIQRIREEGYNI